MKIESVQKQSGSLARGFIFCRTRAGVEEFADEMENEGLRVTSIHGGMPQKKEIAEQ